jgi:hypothetical protein
MAVTLATNFDDFLDLTLYRAINHIVTVSPKDITVPTPTGRIFLRERELPGPTLFEAPCVATVTALVIELNLLPDATWPLGLWFYDLWLYSAQAPYMLTTRGRVRIRA